MVQLKGGGAHGTTPSPVCGTHRETDGLAWGWVTNIRPTRLGPTGPVWSQP